jgi:hypothetical protein
MKLNAGGTAWEVVGTAGFSAGTADYTSIVNAGGEMVVAYSSGKAFAKKIVLSALPVKLISFEVSVKNQNQVSLNWKTASETNNNYFTVSKSEDGKNFTTLTTIKSKEDNGANYETIDFNPIAGTSYYKLAHTDLDGKTEELGIRSVKLASLKEESLSVYSNPVVNGIINIQITKLNGEQTLEMYDLTGKKVISDKVVFGNYKAVYKINKALPKGVYLINISNTFKTQIVIE